MAKIEGGNNSWTWQQNKDFETCLVIYSENSENRWENIAAQINKTPQEVEQHYQILLDDIASIDAGNVDLSYYYDSSSSTRNLEDNNEERKWRKRRGQVWTEDEHKQFLLGLEKYGKGDWKSIARHCVTSRSAIQVASHAQKHFKRQNMVEMAKKKRKRRSIFDITCPNNNGENKGVVVCSNNGGIEQVMPAMVVNDAVPVAWAPPISPPLSNWCVDNEGVLDLGLLEYFDN